MSAATGTLNVSSRRWVPPPSSTALSSICEQNTVSTSGTSDDTVGKPVFDYEEYHPFGSTSWHARDSSLGVSQKRYRYTGKEKDDETGLYYHGARHMAAWLGRWTAADPIGTGGGINRYSYVRNRPVSKYDPTGHADADTLAQQAANKPADGGMCYPQYTDGRGSPASSAATLPFNESAAALKYVNDPKAVARETGPQAFADTGGGNPAPFMDPASVATRMVTEAGPFGVAGAAVGYAAATASGGDQMVGMGIGAASGGLLDPVAIAIGQGGANREIASEPVQPTKTLPTPEVAPSGGKGATDPTTPPLVGVPASEGRPRPPLTFPQGMTSAEFEGMSSKVRAGAGHLSDDIAVHGSRGAGTAMPSSDIDIAIRVSPEAFEQIVRARFGVPNAGSAKEATMLHAIETGKIQAGELGLSGLRKSLAKDLDKRVDLSVVRIDGEFDKGPYIQLR